MIKILLTLFLLCLLAGYIGYRVLRFLTRLVQTVSGIHDAGQRAHDDLRNSGSPFGRSGPYVGSGEKDITARGRIIEEKPGGGD